MFGLTRAYLLAIAGGVSALVLAVCPIASWSAGKAQKARAERAEQTLEVRTTELATCRTSLVNVTTSLERQNAAVAALQAETDAIEARAARAIAAAEKKAERAEVRAKRILAAKPSSTDQCKAAEALQNDAIRSRQQ
jgi:septal ring factor EnvC (AmiA/AmiB activator)